MSYEYMMGMGQNGLTTETSIQDRMQTSPPPGTSSRSAPPPPPPPSADSTLESFVSFVPARMPRTGIMHVIRNGEKFVLLTQSAKTAKMKALRELHTSEGNRLTRTISNNVMGSTLAHRYAGQHYLKFYLGARLTQAEYARVQTALGVVALTNPYANIQIADTTKPTLTLSPFATANIQIADTTKPTLTLSPFAIKLATANLQETQEASDQANSISDQANQEVTDLQNQVTALNEALAAAQAATSDLSTSEEVAALVAQVTVLSEQLNEAKQVAAEAESDAVEAEAEAEVAEEQYEAVVPWYLRYKWHLGIGALVVAGGAYWLTSRRPVRNTRLPTPTSPKHPAGL